MKIIESPFYKHVEKTSHHELGTIYFFQNMAIIEFHEGAHIELPNSTAIIDELSKYYERAKAFGLIANRVNSYSIKILDFTLIKEHLKNLCAYGVVGYNTASKMNAEIENSFCTSRKISYDSLQDAIDDIQNRLNNRSCLFN